MEIKCQLDATEVFIADLIAYSKCFGHHYAHHQELKSIIQWLLPMVFRAVVFQVGLCVRFAGCCSTYIPNSRMKCDDDDDNDDDDNNNNNYYYYYYYYNSNLFARVPSNS